MLSSWRTQISTLKNNDLTKLLLRTIRYLQGDITMPVNSSTLTTSTSSDIKLCMLAGLWSDRVTVDVYNRFIQKCPMTPVVLYTRPNKIPYDEDMEGSLTQMVDMGCAVKNGMGCTHVAVACNTMHLHRDRFMEATGLHMYDMIGATREEAAEHYKCVGLLGTIATMTGGLYEDDRYTLLTPSTLEQEQVQEALDVGHLRPEVHVNPTIKTAVDALAKRGAQCVILGCTDLPTMMEGFPNYTCSVPIIDSIDCLVEMVRKDN